MLDLTPQDRELCQDLTAQLLDRTLYDWEELGLGTARNGSTARLDTRRWKKLHSHPNVALYTERDDSAVWVPVRHREGWKRPVAVVAVGEMQCSLDDILLAVVTPDVATQRLRSVLMGRSPEQCSQVVPIVKPTPDSPFQALAVTRFVNLLHWPMTMFVGPREVMIACATGEGTTSNGTRVGYELFQSVPLHLNNEDHTPMPRTMILQTRVFCEQPNGSVIVYNKLTVDAKNHLPDAMKRGMLCRAVMGFWAFVPRCIEMKKLRWCVKHKNKLSCELQSPPEAAENAIICAGCRVVTLKSSDSGRCRGRSEASRCELCEKWLCPKSSCRANCQLKMIYSGEATMFEQEVAMCPQCIAFVRGCKAADIAQTEWFEAQESRAA